MYQIRFLSSSRVVITGAPGTGKTSIIKGLEAQGFYCFHEIIRNMTAKARKEEVATKQVSNPLVFVKDPYAFNQGLLEGRLKHFLQADKLIEEFCFFDRGIPDVLAYMDFFNQEYGDDFIRICQKNKYDKVFILPPWKEIYISDHERLESFDESERIHEYLLQTYRDYGYEPIPVPKTMVADRVSFVLEQLKT